MHGIKFKDIIMKRMIYILLLVPSCMMAMNQAHNPFLTNDDGENALFTASDTATIKLLLDAGTPVNHKKYLGRTALMSRVALEESFKNILPLFLAAKADLNIQDEFGDTVAIRAVMFENQTGLKALIDAGADLSIRNAQGKTALDIAKEIGDFGAIKIIENKNK